MAESLFIRHGGDAAGSIAPDSIFGQSDSARLRPAASVGPAEAIHPSAKRLILSMGACFLPPVVAFFALQGGGPLAWIVEYLAAVQALALYRYLRTGRRGAATAVPAKRPRSGALERLDRFVPRLRAILLSLGAVAIFIGLDITPASAFLAWFALVAHGSAGGTIAYLFTVMFAFFSAVFAGIALSGDLLFALLALVSVDLFLCGVVLGHNALSILAAAIFVGALLYYAARRLGRVNVRSTVAVVQVALAAALVALPVSSLVGSNGVIDGLFSLRFSGVVSRIFPNFPFLYSVPGYGNSFSSTLLGQRPDLTSRPVFEVTGPPGATVYLRTAVYDVYTGTGWRLSRYERRRGSLAAYFYDYGPRTLPPSSTETISVKLLADFYGSLPNTLDTIGFQFPRGATPSLTYGSLDSGFVLDSPLTRGAVVTDVIDNSPLPRTTVGFIENLPGFNGRRALYGDAARRAVAWDFGRRTRQGARESRWADTLPNWLRGASTIPSRYTITRREEEIDLATAALPKEVVDLAHSLQRPTEGQTIDAIRSFLKNNYLYSLTTRAAGPAGDTVDDFLFHSKTGYCVQFATAFVILARLDGIPSRYVTGFLVYLPPHGRSAVVTGLSAHAWAEVWSPHSGWTTEEATPPMIASAFSDPQFYAHFNPTDSSATQKELEAVLGNRVPIQAAKRAPTPRRHKSDGGPVWLPAAGGGLLAAALLALLLLSITRRFSPSDVRMRRVVGRIMSRSRAHDLPDPGRRGWSAWASALALRHPARRAVTLRAGDIILQRSFNGGGRTARDLRFLERFCRWAFGPARIVRRSNPGTRAGRSRDSVDRRARDLVQPRGR